MQLRDDNIEYDYIYTHVYYFKVVVKNPSIWIDRIASIFLIKEHGPRNYYRRNNYTYHSDQNIQIHGCQTYAKESVARVERLYGCLTKESTPIRVTDCHSELDDTPLLDIDDHHKFQMLLEILQCMVAINKLELYQVVSCPREGHLYLVVR